MIIEHDELWYVLRVLVDMEVLLCPQTHEDICDFEAVDVTLKTLRTHV
jgi:hypothetical protein